MIAKIDQAILDFWFTNPDDRAWAYGMTLLPLLALIASIINYLQKGRLRMTKTEDQLENEIIAVQDKIINAGKYVAAVCEGIPNEGTITYEDGVVITDPLEKADDIIKTAHDIKKMAIQYQALTKLEDKIFEQNKKAVDSEDSLATDSL